MRKAYLAPSPSGLKPLQCYGDNYNNSFYTFVENSFMGFKFPNVTAFLSLMPDNRRHQVCVRRTSGECVEPSSVDLFDVCFPSSLWTRYLRRIWAIFSVGPMSSTTTRSSAWFTAATRRRRSSWRPYVSNAWWWAEVSSVHICCPHSCASSPQEALPAVVRRPTLPCVWPMALSSSKRSEVNRWFDQSLKNYLVFLRKSLISPSVTYNSSCLAFQKLYVAQQWCWKIYLFTYGSCEVSFNFPAFLFLVNSTTPL